MISQGVTPVANGTIKGIKNYAVEKRFTIQANSGTNIQFLRSDVPSLTDSSNVLAVIITAGDANNALSNLTIASTVYYGSDANNGKLADVRLFSTSNRENQKITANVLFV